MRKRKQPRAWLAGTEPHGSCKHIAAFCYALEEFCRIRSLRPPESYTSQPQAWNQPRKWRLDACDVSEVEFIKHEYRKVKKSPRPLLYDPRPEGLRCTTEEEVEMHYWRTVVHLFYTSWIILSYQILIRFWLSYKNLIRFYRDFHKGWLRSPPNQTFSLAAGEIGCPSATQQHSGRPDTALR